MPKLPVISGMKTVKAFQKAGWTVKRQTGSHIIMEKAEYIATLSVPNHKEIKRGTLKNLIKDAKLTIEEFLDLL
ncbi:MAG: type II toxin-antitoxin system HicA family toxin [Methanobacterium sp.]|nr:type II toxin-antitoxin system HicA family toxin [Euryarchaeota archaeon]MBU4607720.1 type II toxin-antitoxin system HicA family toxin [Euryarchaeota archaeon]MBV1730320.1 type II toxin-antitoxin system HicA family toxin [Methanobacterium sp.]MBV1756150.1 type II toxin-antitoxin system HicA family toxin [Methanobacterium sp.]MBV1768155.1 type II toxin-antitoxin system HicA family toxin [Methanobacterium sp.]